MSMVTGRVYITINGLRLRSKEGAKLNIGGIEREPAMSDAGIDGYTERLSVPSVDCSIHHTVDTQLSDFQSFRDGTLIFETDTGRTYTIQGAWCVKAPEMTKGEVSLQFQGVECIEG